MPQFPCGWRHSRRRGRRHLRNGSQPASGEGKQNCPTFTKISQVRSRRVSLPIWRIGLSAGETKRQSIQLAMFLAGTKLSKKYGKVNQILGVRGISTNGPFWREILIRKENSSV